MENLFEVFIGQNNSKIDSLVSRIRSFKKNGLYVGIGGEDGAKSRVINWIKNFYLFGFKDLMMAVKLLEGIIYIEDKIIIEKLTNISREYLEDEYCLCPLGEESESSFRLTSNFNQHKNYYSNIEDLLDEYSEDKKGILFYDDFLNSGGQVISIFYRLFGVQLEKGSINDEYEGRHELSEVNKGRLRNIKIYFFYYMAFADGIEKVEEKIKEELGLDVSILKYNVSNKNDSPFGDCEEQEKIELGASGVLNNNSVFNGCSYKELKELYVFLKLIGKGLLIDNEKEWSEGKYDSRVMGYGNHACLYITEYNVPSVTITALWLSGNIMYEGQNLTWNSLLPRRKKKLRHSYANVGYSQIIENDTHVDSYKSLLCVTNNDKLDLVSVSIPYVENYIIGKFVLGGISQMWSEVKQNLSLDQYNIVDLDNGLPIIFITGQSGIGKSTYLFYVIDEYMKAKESANFVFLNPERSALWSDEVYDVLKISNKDIVLVLDAINRSYENNSEYVERFKIIYDICTRVQEISDYKSYANIKAIITLKDDELGCLLNNIQFRKLNTISTVKRMSGGDIDIQKLVKSIFDGDEELRLMTGKEKMMEMIYENSIGSPYYIRHFFIEFKRQYLEGLVFTDIKIPIGIINYIWSIVADRFMDSRIMYFILCVMLEVKGGVSDVFINMLLKDINSDLYNPDNEDVVNSVKGSCFIRVGYLQRFYDLDSHWKGSVVSGMKNIEIIDVRYRALCERVVLFKITEYNKIKNKIIGGIVESIKENSDNESSIYMLLDLLNINDELCDEVVELYNTIYTGNKDPEIINYFEQELYSILVDRAEYFIGISEIDKAMRYYEIVVGDYMKNDDVRYLHKYAYFLQKYVMPNNSSTDELKYREVKDKILSIYSRILCLSRHDGLSYFTRAMCYKNMREYINAESDYKKAIALDNENITYYSEFINYLSNRAKKLNNAYGLECDKYIDQIEGVFNDAFNMISCMSDYKKERYSYNIAVLYGFYAEYYLLKSRVIRDKNESMIMIACADSVFIEIMSKYPEVYTVYIRYSQFLMDVGFKLEKYSDGKNIDISEEILIGLLKNDNLTSHFRMSICFNIAHLLSHIRPRHYVKEYPRYQDALYYYNQVADGYSVKMRNIAMLELADMYLIWSLYCEEGQRNEKIEKSRAIINKLKDEMPDNVENYQNIIRLEIVLSMYYLLNNDLRGSIRFIKKAIILSQKNTIGSAVLKKTIISTGDLLRYVAPNNAILYYKYAIRIIKANVGGDNERDIVNKLIEAYRLMSSRDNARFDWISAETNSSKVLKYSPDDLSAIYMYIKALFFQEKYQYIIDYYKVNIYNKEWAIVSSEEHVKKYMLIYYDIVRSHKIVGLYDEMSVLYGYYSYILAYSSDAATRGKIIKFVNTVKKENPKLSRNLNMMIYRDAVNSGNADLVLIILFKIKSIYKALGEYYIVEIIEGIISSNDVGGLVERYVKNDFLSGVICELRRKKTKAKNRYYSVYKQITSSIYDDEDRMFVADYLYYNGFKNEAKEIYGQLYYHSSGDVKSLIKYIIYQMS
jgi:hypothetical protein